MHEWLELVGVGLGNLLHRGRITAREAAALGGHRDWWRLRWALWREGRRSSAGRMAGREAPQDLIYGETPPLTAWQILRDLGVGPQDHIVDLGCGLGIVPIVGALFFGATAEGFEIVPGLVEKARRLVGSMRVSGVVLREGDVRELELPAASVYFLSPTALCENSWRRLQIVLEAAPPGAHAVCLTVPLPASHWDTVEMRERPYSWGHSRTYVQTRKTKA